jgi:hypothetical protein
LGDARAIEPVLQFLRNPPHDIVDRWEAVRDEAEVALTALRRLIATDRTKASLLKLRRQIE